MHDATMTPDLELVQHLVLSVRRLPHRPNRWAWDLKDGRDGSWFESMWEFESEERARRSGLSRILELARSVPGEPTSHIVIVASHADRLYVSLAGAFRGSEGVQVIRDRRRLSAKLDRRDIERRSRDIGMVLRTRGWAIVCRSGVHGSERIDEAA